jgi:glycosyltransferase involved in cell wall biosynthesis
MASVRRSAPALTAAMIVRDGEATIDAAISSVLSQTFEDFELVVVDDGSKDSTRNVVEEFLSDGRVFLHRTDPGGRGRAFARNRCLEEARGEYLAICDADDLSHPERFERQIGILRADPLLVAVSAQTRVFGPWGGPTMGDAFPEGSHIATRFAAGHMAIPHCAAMFRTLALRRIGGYNSECQRAQDLEVCLRLRAIGGFEVLPHPLVDYRLDRRFPSLSRWMENASFRRYALHSADCRLRGDDPGTAERFFATPRLKALRAVDFVHFCRLLTAHHVRRLAVGS